MQSSKYKYSIRSPLSSLLEWRLNRIYSLNLLDAFAKLWKANFSFVVCACLCVCMEQLGSHWTNFKVATLISDKPCPPPLPYKPCYDEIWYLMILWNSFEKIQHSLKSYKNDWYFTWSLCTFKIISRWNILRLRNVFDRVCRQNQNTYVQ